MNTFIRSNFCIRTTNTVANINRKRERERERERVKRRQLLLARLAENVFWSESKKSETLDRRWPAHKPPPSPPSQQQQEQPNTACREFDSRTKKISFWVSKTHQFVRCYFQAGTSLGVPVRVEPIGRSEISYPIFLEFVLSLSDSKYR